MGFAITVLGFIALGIASIWIIVNAFKESVLWGLGSILIPLVSVIFVFMHWDENKKPFFIYIIGVVVVIVGAVLTGASTPSSVS